MQITNPRILCAAVILLVASRLSAADENKAPREEKKEMRVLAATPGNERRAFGRPIEKEKVTFLGVETAPVSSTLSAQLGLPKGSALVVHRVVPDSAAITALQKDDILLRLDDQILIEPRQLEVLIRNHKEGDEITLTYLRAGKQATAKVKLGQKEVPKFSAVFEQRIPLGGAAGFALGSGSEPFELRLPEGEARENVDRVLSLIRPDRDGEPVRVQIDRRHGPGFRSTSINVANSNLVYSDDDGSLELSLKDGEKTLVAKNPKGEPVFSGPVNTPEQRAAMPESVRGRLQKLESMHDMTFRTDGDFRGADAKVLQPAPRGISLRVEQPEPRRSNPIF